jgi:hypothetical protein
MGICIKKAAQYFFLQNWLDPTIIYTRRYPDQTHRIGKSTEFFPGEFFVKIDSKLFFVKLLSN